MCFTKQAIILGVEEVVPIVMEELRARPAARVTMKDVRQLQLQNVFLPHILVPLVMMMQIALDLPHLLIAEEQENVYSVPQVTIVGAHL